MGLERITTVLVAASAQAPADPYDLTDLATVKDELEIAESDESNDAFLQRAITASSTLIQSYCSRSFAVEALQEAIYLQQDPYPYQVPGGVDALQLSRWPIALPAIIPFSGNTHGSILVDGIASTKGILPGTLIFAADGSLPTGTQVKTVNPTSLILSNPASSTGTVSFTTGLQVVQTLSVGNLQTLVFGTDFAVDAKRGWLIRLNGWTGVAVRWESIPVTVQYSAGFPTIPGDLVEACLRLITARFKAKTRDPMLLEQSQGGTLGVQRFWVGSQPGQTGALPPEIESMIDAYRVPVAA